MEKEVDLIVYEGMADSGLVADLRQGVEPDSERLENLRLALETVASSIGESTKIDRQLAAALHTLSFDASGLISGWEAQGRKWHSEDLEEQMPAIYELIDEIFGTL